MKTILCLKNRRIGRGIGCLSVQSGAKEFPKLIILNLPSAEGKTNKKVLAYDD